tara:strand:- start:602 stop:784 length:183 start_codon:yes stop_codon:yes gene_type:complete
MVNQGKLFIFEYFWGDCFVEFGKFEANNKSEHEYCAEGSRLRCEDREDSIFAGYYFNLLE